MRIGAPKEIKIGEGRVGLTPEGAAELTRRGHSVLVERDAGIKAGFSDADYQAVGARIAPDAAALWGDSELIVKVKEPQPDEVAKLRPDHTLYCYLHLAAVPALATGLCASGCVAVAFETVGGPRGGLPLLAPMSEIAGRIAVQAGAHCLETHQGGRGVLLGGAVGAPRGKVAVIGAGVVGTNALRMALGLEARVTVLDSNLERLRALDELYGARLDLAYASAAAIEKAALEADLLIGAVLIPGARAPKLVSEALVARMQPGAVIVDVAVDQGGCVETIHPTTHAEPTYLRHGVIHYGVANMPGAVPWTSTRALAAATLPGLIALADKGWRRACDEDPYLAGGLTVVAGKITHPAVRAALAA